MSGESEFCFEQFLPWIHKLMLAYPEHNNRTDSQSPTTKYNGFSQGYYTKKLN